MHPLLTQEFNIDFDMEEDEADVQKPSPDGKAAAAAIDAVPQGTHTTGVATQVPYTKSMFVV